MPDQTFTSGQILTAQNQTDLQNNIGLSLIKTQTIGNGVATVNVTGAFSATFDNYKITVSGGVGSGVQTIDLYMGTTVVASGYYSTRVLFLLNAANPSGAAQSNVGAFAYAGQSCPTFNHMNVDLFNPFNAKNTTYSAPYILPNSVASEFGHSAGFLDDTTSYTSFSIKVGGTMTGGTIAVYGYRK
jgi:hypothetical protein